MVRLRRCDREPAATGRRPVAQTLNAARSSAVLLCVNERRAVPSKKANHSPHEKCTPPRSHFHWPLGYRAARGSRWVAQLPLRSRRSLRPARPVGTLGSARPLGSPRPPDLLRAARRLGRSLCAAQLLRRLRSRIPRRRPPRLPASGARPRSVRNARRLLLRPAVLGLAVRRGAPARAQTANAAGTPARPSAPFSRRSNRGRWRDAPPRRQVSAGLRRVTPAEVGREETPLDRRQRADPCLYVLEDRPGESRTIDRDLPRLRSGMDDAEPRHGRAAHAFHRLAVAATHARRGAARLWRSEQAHPRRERAKSGATLHRALYDFYSETS